jgi:centrosomal protein CEP120
MILIAADFRAAVRATPEAELTRQLAEAREAAKGAEARAAKAAKAKQGYKEQVGLEEGKKEKKERKTYARLQACVKGALSQ